MGQQLVHKENIMLNLSATDKVMHKCQMCYFKMGS